MWTAWFRVQIIHILTKSSGLELWPVLFCTFVYIWVTHTNSIADNLFYLGPKDQCSPMTRFVVENLCFNVVLSAHISAYLSAILVYLQQPIARAILHHVMQIEQNNTSPIQPVNRGTVVLCASRDVPKRAVHWLMHIEQYNFLFSVLLE